MDTTSSGSRRSDLDRSVLDREGTGNGAAVSRTPQPKRDIRCAIYTRKSTSDGLEQEFNSLDAQREACQKYIESQRGEGWRLVLDRFDDGGFTGANTDRPALQKIFEAIRAGRVDCVVVYKVDRLSRSLLDFAKIIELFEKHEVAFVSVTQQFNTSSSMGRLTLNVLLSFAQFEREIISERTRDKIAAVRRKGKWIGGLPPIGYDAAPEGKRLVVNPKEAALVRKIFDLYLEQRSIIKVANLLNDLGHTTKLWTAKNGRTMGGRPFTLTTVQHILQNVFYTGWILYRGELYRGEHEAILPEDLFREVETIKSGNRAHRSSVSPGAPDALLKGMLRCRSCGCALIHTYARKRGKRYRYYVCGRAQKRGYAFCPAPSVQAHAVEKAAIDCLCRAAADSKELSASEFRAFFADVWPVLVPQERDRVFRTLVREVGYEAGTGTMDLVLNERGIRRFREEMTGAA